MRGPRCDNYNTMTTTACACARHRRRRRSIQLSPAASAPVCALDIHHNTATCTRLSPLSLEHSIKHTKQRARVRYDRVRVFVKLDLFVRLSVCLASCKLRLEALLKRVRVCFVTQAGELACDKERASSHLAATMRESDTHTHARNLRIFAQRPKHTPSSTATTTKTTAYRLIAFVRPFGSRHANANARYRSIELASRARSKWPARRANVLLRTHRRGIARQRARQPVTVWLLLAAYSLFIVFVAGSHRAHALASVIFARAYACVSGEHRGLADKTCAGAHKTPIEANRADICCTGTSSSSGSGTAAPTNARAEIKTRSSSIARVCCAQRKELDTSSKSERATLTSSTRHVGANWLARRPANCASAMFIYLFSCVDAAAASVKLTKVLKTCALSS